jgi:hypothetical protein
MARVVVAVATALLLVGCGSGNGSADQAEPTATTPTTTTAECKPLGGSVDKQERPSGSGVAAILLKNVEVQGRDCTDRVVFAFRGAEIPGYTISYEPAATAKIEDGSGRKIEISGSAFLVVRLLNVMTAEISGEQVKPTYTGPRRITADGTRYVREVVKTGDFESTVTWVIGLDEKRPFKAQESPYSTSLLVDFG